ncbi:hypothetical protein AAG906_038453 [Vitis piasezkii]
MFGSTMEMMDIRAMKTCITLRLLTKTDLGSRVWIQIGGRLVRGLDPHSQLAQISDHRDMDPQYAIVD